MRVPSSFACSFGYPLSIIFPARVSLLNPANILGRYLCVPLVGRCAGSYRYMSDVNGGLDGKGSFVTGVRAFASTLMQCGRQLYFPADIVRRNIHTKRAVSTRYETCVDRLSCGNGLAGITWPRKPLALTYFLRCVGQLWAFVPLQSLDPAPSSGER